MGEGVRLYAGTQHGLIIWKSTGNGWQEVARHFEDGIIDSIFGCKTSPEKVFAGVTHEGLYQTLDGGKSWARVLEGDIRSVTVEPTDDNVIYAGIEPVGLFRSEDAGGHWEEITALKELSYAVRKNWWYPQPPHHGHVRNIHIHPISPPLLMQIPIAQMGYRVRRGDNVAICRGEVASHSSLPLRVSTFAI